MHLFGQLFSELDSTTRTLDKVLAFLAGLFLDRMNSIRSGRTSWSKFGKQWHFYV